MDIHSCTIYLPKETLVFTVGEAGVVRILEHGERGVSIFTSLQPAVKTRYFNVAYSY